MAWNIEFPQHQQKVVYKIYRREPAVWDPRENSRDTTGTDGLAFNALHLGPNIGRNVRISTMCQTPSASCWPISVQPFMFYVWRAK